MTGNGKMWGSSDPATRRLRIMAFFVLAALTCYAVIAGRDVVTIGSLLGAFLIDLGFEVGIRFPGTNGSSSQEYPQNTSYQQSTSYQSYPTQQPTAYPEPTSPADERG